MKIQNKLKIFILIILLLLLILFLIHSIKNYIIISKISDKQIQLNNYSLIIEYYQLGQDKTTIEQNYKDGKMLQILKKDDNEIVRYWYDEDSKELISILNTNDLNATIEKNVVHLFVIELSLGYDSVKKKINDILGTFISYEELDGQKCYVLNKGKKIKDYISIESGKILKRINNDNIVEYKELYINNLTDEDISRPNLNSYEIKYL